MALAADFHFSQESLQDYLDCPRRFQLRYLLRQQWPAVRSEPILESERWMQQGAQFHHLVQQYWLGLPVERLTAMAYGAAASLAPHGEDGDLLRWWGNFLAYAPRLAGYAQVQVEYAISALVKGFHLSARYDWIGRTPDGAFSILDWKTYRRPPRRQALAARMQTRVYPCLLVAAGAQLNAGCPISPDQVELVYWIADIPDTPQHFPYSIVQYHKDLDYLAALVEGVRQRGDTAGDAAGFEMTTALERCTYCVYRSLCDRGRRAGAFLDGEDVEAALEGGSGPGLEAGLSDLDFDMAQAIPW